MIIGQYSNTGGTMRIRASLDWTISGDMKSRETGERRGLVGGVESDQEVQAHGARLVPTQPQAT